MQVVHLGDLGRRKGETRKVWQPVKDALSSQLPRWVTELDLPQNVGSQCGAHTRGGRESGWGIYPPTFPSVVEGSSWEVLKT